MKQTFEEFSKNIVNLHAPRVHKIKNSYYTINGLKHYTKIRPKDDDFIISQVEYLSIIREMNLLLVDSLIKNKFFRLPCGMGILEVCKAESRSWINDDGRLISSKPIDYVETKRLWYEDEDARAKKTLVRFDVDYVFRLKHGVKGRRYHNAKYFSLKFGRFTKSKLADTIKNGDYDTYELKNRFNEQNKIHKS